MNEKSAQDVMESLRRLGSNTMEGIGNAGNKISDWYQGLNPNMRSAVGRGLAGATADGLLTGGLAAMTPRDPEQKGGVMGPALLGALLGGGAAAGLPYGWDMLKGKVKLPGEKSPGILGQVGETVGAPFVQNPGVTAGLAGGLALRQGWAAGSGSEVLGAALDKVKRTNPSVFARLQTIKRTGIKGVGRAIKRAPARHKALFDAIKAVGPKAQTIDASKIMRGARRGGKGALYGLPASLLAGWLGQRYLKGEV